MVDGREIDLAGLVPEEGGAATRELEAAPGGSPVDETVVLGTPQGVYRFTVARADGGPLTVEAKPLAPHAEVTRMRVDGATLHVEGAVPPESGEPAYLFARRRGDVMEVVVPAHVDGERFSASLDLGELVVPGEQRDVWNLRLELGRRGAAARHAPRRHPQPQRGDRVPRRRDRRPPRAALLHDREQRLGALPAGRRGAGGRAARAARRGRQAAARPARARPARGAGAPARAAARRRAPAGARSRPTAATCGSCCCTRGGWAAPCARR